MDTVDAINNIYNKIGHVNFEKYNQDNINLMMSHINSISRKMNCNEKVHTPFQTVDK